MSSPEPEDYNESENAISKKRRVQRACDICRRKKVRCDGGQMPNNRCTNCITYNHKCTYMEAAKKRGPPKSYVEGLENRLMRMEKLLHKFCPDADLSQELDGVLDKESWRAKGNNKVASSSATQGVVLPTIASTSLPVAVDVDDLDPSDEEISSGRHTLEHHMNRLKLDPGQPRFFGKSSSVMFLQNALDLKREYAGIPKEREPPGPGSERLPYKRPQFWRAHPWILETIQPDTQYQEFPEKDLMDSLIDLYFTRSNLFLPILHRPTFESSIAEGLHFHDEGFGSTLLLVCALGSRFSNDPRVLLDGIEDEHSAGWKWFRLVHWTRRSLLAAPRLYDLQIACLTAIFLNGSSTPQASWTVIGVGIRLAQDVGAHRRKVYNPVRTVEEELWKRAFWVLVYLDRFNSSALGRPCAIHDEDFDLDLPVECDDEYWIHEDPQLAFKQPPGKPSIVAYFNCSIRLNQILAFALRTIYSINKSKVLLGFVGQQWEQHIVAELDSALNKWIDSVPDHLRWDPNKEDDVFFNQSASLYATYYHLQILVHRPFIPSPRKPSPLSYPSLAICTNAARSCIHVLDVQYQRGDNPLFAHQFQHRGQIALFAAGIVLLLSIWGGKQAGVSTNPAREMADVHKAMKMLKALERRWHTAGRIWDIMYELACVGDLPLPEPSPPPSHKRERDSDSPISNVSSAPSPSASITTTSGLSSDEPRHFAGSRRVVSSIQQRGSRSPSQSSLVPSGATGGVGHSTSTSTLPHFTLPIHSADLGRLPFNATFGNDSSLAPENTGWLSADYMQPGLAHIHPYSQATTPAIPPDNLFSQTTEMDASYSSTMYDQVMSNLAGSMAPVSQYPSSVDPQRMPLPTESLDHLLTTLGSDGVMFPNDNGVLSMWSSAPTGFEWDDWGTYINHFGGSANKAN